MSRTMRALIVSEPGQFELTELPLPDIGPYQALVRIEVCGICNSTDWKVIHGQMQWAGGFPLVLGHESVGVVEQVGQKVRHFKVGDRVTRPIYPSGQNRMNAAFGGFADYGVVCDARAMADEGDPGMLTDYNAQRQNVVPPGLGPIEAALAISLSETASVLNALPNLRGLVIVIAGTGIAGLSLAFWCKLAGATTLVLGRRPERLAKARQLGADQAINTTEADWIEQLTRAAGPAIDGVIEAVGDPELAEQLQRQVRPDGFLTAYGAPPTGQAYPEPWHVADVAEHTAYPWVADLIERNWLDPDWFITHRWSPDQIIQAFDEVRNGNVLKGFVLFDSLAG